MSRTPLNTAFLLKLSICKENIDTEEEKEWIEPRLNALVEDIENLEVVDSAILSRSEQGIIIQIRSAFGIQDLKDKLRPYLIRDNEYFRCNLTENCTNSGAKK